jgi:hypothetical protein
MALYSSVDLEQQSRDAISQFSLPSGATATFVFGGLRPPGQQPELEVTGERFHQTARFWKAWAAPWEFPAGLHPSRPD